MSGTALLDHFSALEDPRQAWKVVYLLPEILLIVLCGTMAGAEDFVEIERWANRKLDFLRRLLPFEKGIPSHDTLNDVMNALPAAAFSDCFVSWVAGLRDDDPDIVAIDGKTSRRAHNRGKGLNPLHLVSAWASRRRLVLGQQACAEKSNEIHRHPGAARTPGIARCAGHHPRIKSEDPPSAARPGSPKPSATAAPTTCWR